MTSIKLTSGANMAGLQFNIANGYTSTPMESVWIRTYEDGVYTGYEYTNQSVSRGAGFSIVSAGNAFNEVRVQSALSYKNGTYYGLQFKSESETGAVSIDNLVAFSAIPEPTTFSLLGFGAVIAAIHRRRRID